MTAQRWERIKELFEAALKRSPEERSAFLAEACAADYALRDEVLRLLADHCRAGGLLDKPVLPGLAGPSQRGTPEGFVPGEPAPTPIPKMTKLGKFEIHQQLGRGGMGLVYQAWDPAMQRWVALKTITQDLAARAEFVECFHREAVAAGKLDHPNIVTIYETGEEGDVCYIAMQFLEGNDLESLIRLPDWDQEFTIFRKLDILIQICRGLAYAHGKGVVHRDVKPANVMILADGTPKIVDFGIARIGETTSASRTIVGTAAYMAPEQLEGNVVDERVDVFAVGVVTYRMFTRHLPFEADSLSGVLYKIIHGPPPPLSAYVADCPPDLERIVLTALAKDRDQRYRTMEELGFEFQRLLSSLNTTLVSSYVEEARRLVLIQDFLKAKELLRKVLELEPANAAASEMWQQVQKLFQEEHNRRKVQSLREEGIQAYRRGDWVRALECFNQGLQLDQTNETLLSYRELTLREQEKIQAITQKMKEAQEAQRRGDLTAARNCLVEVLQLSPQNTEAKSLLTQVEAELAQMRNRREAQQIVDRAQRALTAQAYPEALSLLEKAEALDPENRHLARLRSVVLVEQAAAQKQRLRGEKIAAARASLERGDFTGAAEEAQKGLQAFPDDPALQQLLLGAKQGLETAEQQKETAVSPPVLALAQRAAAGSASAQVTPPFLAPTVVSPPLSGSAVDVEPRPPRAAGGAVSVRASGTAAEPTPEALPATHATGSKEEPELGTTPLGFLARLRGVLERFLAQFTPGFSARLRGAVERLPVRPSHTWATLRLAKFWFGMAGAVLVLAAWFFPRLGSRRAAKPPVPPTGTVTLNVSPWGKVKEVRNLQTQDVLPLLGQTTPLEVALPAGDFEVALDHPTLGSMRFTLHVESGRQQDIRKSFQTFDPEQVLKSYR